LRRAGAMAQAARSSRAAWRNYSPSARFLSTRTGRRCPRETLENGLVFENGGELGPSRCGHLQAHCPGVCAVGPAFLRHSRIRTVLQRFPRTATSRSALKEIELKANNFSTRPAMSELPAPSPRPAQMMPPHLNHTTTHRKAPQADIDDGRAICTRFSWMRKSFRRRFRPLLDQA